MRRKVWIFSVIGFLAGMLIGNLIAWIMAGTVVNARAAAWTGSEAGAVALQTLLSGLFGAVCMGGVMIHEIESWSIARCAVVHYLMIEAAYILVATLLGWYGSPAELLISLAVHLAVYLVIWLIMYRRYRAEVRKLNELLKAKEEAAQEK